MADTEQSDVTALTVQLLSAYLGNNTVAPAELAELIRSTRTVLSEPQAQPDAEPSDVHTPAVSVRKSVANPEHLISLIDGKPYKTLKRHLTRHGLTPETYRNRYNLPPGYPMVAPAFAEKRRAIAEAIGLGRQPKPGKAETSKAAPAPAEAKAKASAPGSTSRKADASAQSSNPSSAAQAEPETTKPKSRTGARAKTASGKPAAKKATKPAGKKPARSRGKLKLKLSGAETAEATAAQPGTPAPAGDNVPAADGGGQAKPERRMARPRSEGSKPEA